MFGTETSNSSSATDLLNITNAEKIVGVDINATHHKSALSGVVTAVATAVSLGKTLCCYEVEITNDKGERTCTARITCLILAER